MNNTTNKQCNDLLSFGSGNEISEGNRHSDDLACKGLERNGNILLECGDSSDFSKLDLGVTLIKDENIIIINPDDNDNRLCRTIKAQVSRNGLCNFFHKGTFGGTGVMEIYE